MIAATLQEQLRRWVLLIGVVQVLFGCLVGFIPPTAVTWFRGIVMAHIEFTANGVLMIAIGLLAREMRLAASAWRAWFVTLLVGTWFNGAAGLVGAFAGQSSQLMPTLNQSFPAPGGAASPVVTGLLMVCGAMIVTALVLTIVGLARAPRLQVADREVVV
jgi:small-conductance mechanosensitive channel